LEPFDVEDSFLTVAEVAQLLKLNEQTVRNWIDNGSLPAVRVGPRRVRIRESDLERLIAAGSDTAREARQSTGADESQLAQAHFDKPAGESDGVDWRLRTVQEKLEAFRDDRDWRRFHTLKDLAASVSIEAAELQEMFLWQRVEDEKALLGARRGEIEDELADVLIQCLNFASVAGIDVLAAIERKIEKNAIKYPIGESEPKRWS
jgi:dCTP diphosphatase